MIDKENDDEELRTALSTIFDDKVMEFDNVVDMYRNPISAKLMYEVSKNFEYSLKTQILLEQGKIGKENLGIVHNSMDFYQMVDREESKGNDDYELQELENDYKERLEQTFEELITEMITNILRNIKIIKGISPNAITLPEDIVVYRGVRTDEKINLIIVSTSEFISTSLIERAAMKYIINGQGDNSALFRIKLPKSTPVCIFSKTVKNDGLFGHKLMLTDDANIHEIMIDTSKVKDFEILECKDIKKDNEELSL